MYQRLVPQAMRWRLATATITSVSGPCYTASSDVSSDASTEDEETTALGPCNPAVPAIRRG